MYRRLLVQRPAGKLLGDIQGCEGHVEWPFEFTARFGKVQSRGERNDEGERFELASATVRDDPPVLRMG